LSAVANDTTLCAQWILSLLKQHSELSGLRINLALPFSPRLCLRSATACLPQRLLVRPSLCSAYCDKDLNPFSS